MAGPLEDSKEDLIDHIREIAEDGGDDSWTVQFGWFHRAKVPGEGPHYTGSGIINDEEWRVVAYLQGIDALWELGGKAPIM
ncbi:MAG: hypothetical protein PW843_00910 [Azospirillaceae bacterium]|nr:hypothetical protein [Azospirillaceae bacterium]